MEDKDHVGEYNKAVANMFDDMPPFSIVINNGHDAAWISSAMMLFMTGGNNSNSRKALELLVQQAVNHGVDAAVDDLLDVLKEKDIGHPVFVGPVFRLMVGHAIKSKSEGQ